MSFDRETLDAAVARHGAVHRVVVAAVRGSAPREAGASMLVWTDGQSGTIGGGALEWEAARQARAGEHGLTRHPLGPSLGQCCGGAVTLLTELWDAERLAALDPDDPLVVRGPGRRPLAVDRILAAHRGGRAPALPALIGDWMVERVSAPRRIIWIWGAGHVGRALVEVLSPLPDLAITWIDTAEDRFPDIVPDGVSRVVAADPATLAAHAPAAAEHLVLTYSHQIDLSLCHALLSRPTGGIGLIGSATKWARFQSRLRRLGHPDARISGIRCPIGSPALGKHPQAIAVGVAADLLERSTGLAKREAG